MTTKEIRRYRLVLLVEQWKARTKGSQRAFATECDLSPGHLSQMINGTREVGDAVARRVEKAQLLTDNYLDSPLNMDEGDPLDEEGAALFIQLKGRKKEEGLAYLRSLLRTQVMEEKVNL